MREKPTPRADRALAWIGTRWSLGGSNSERRCTFRKGPPVFPFRNTGFAGAEQLHDELPLRIEGFPTGDHAIGAWLAYAPQLGHAGSLQVQAELRIQHVEPGVSHFRLLTVPLWIWMQ